jgi:hypothetical protein
MRLAWKHAVATIIVAVVVFGAGACSATKADGGKAEAAATATKPTDPKDALLNSLTSYNKGVYAMTFTTADGNGSGTIDSVNRQGHLKTTSTEPDTSTIEVLTLGAETYLKMDMGELAQTLGLDLLTGKKWMRIDRSKIEDLDDLRMDVSNTDFLSLRAMLGSAQSVQVVGDRKYGGTLDLSKDENSPLTDDELFTALGSKVSAVPFTVTLDAQGQLAELLIDVPVAGDIAAHQLKMTLNEYGAVTLPTAPTGSDVVEAPDTVYRMLNA